MASIWLWLPSIISHADEPPTAQNGAEHTRVVLLRNDRCLTGLVRQLGDQVVIEFDDDARVSKPASDIQFIADDLESVYQYKLARYAHLGPGENIRVARWCLSVGLHEHASRHFLAVHKEAGENPLVKQLGVELREQLLEDEDFRIYLGLLPLQPASDKLHPVRTVAAGSGASPIPIVPAVLAAFTDQVQPILVNRCSQSGCHGLSATNKLKIIQPMGTARARISEQNCRSALQFVAVDDSNMSVLLRYALTAHAIQKLPSIASQEPRLMETLQSWTTFARNPVMAAVENNAAGTSGSASPAVYTDRTGEAVPASGLRPVGPGAALLRTVPRQPIYGVQGASESPSISELDQLDDQVRRALGEPPRTAIPAAGSKPAPGAGSANAPLSSDPFDPAEFNRAAAAKAKS